MNADTKYATLFLVSGGVLIVLGLGSQRLSRLDRGGRGWLAVWALMLLVVGDLVEIWAWAGIGLLLAGVGLLIGGVGVILTLGGAVVLVTGLVRNLFFPGPRRRRKGAIESLRARAEAEKLREHP